MAKSKKPKKHYTVSKPTAKKTLRGSLRSLINSPQFAKKYAIFAVIVLLATTLFWSIYSARLQSGNADQLVNPFLFENSATFHNATFPGSHSFLLKWPLFMLIKLLGFSSSAYSVVTVGLVLITIAGLVAILYRIERRPLVFGTICLALASTLLMIPAEAYSGGLLPVNMAMITTRNLEYIMYVGSLALIVKSRGIRSWGFWVASLLLTLLVASDKLFLTISLGGAFLALMAYGLSGRRRLVALVRRWLIVSILAAGAGVGLLWLLNALDLTHFESKSSIGPYGLVFGVHHLILGTIYAGLGILTNFGANPAFDTSILRDIPHQLLLRLGSLGGVTFVINALILGAGSLLTGRLVVATLGKAKPNRPALSSAMQLSVLLIWSSLVALGAFIFSDHYYPADARYLTITLFAVFITLASFTRQKSWRPEKMVVIGAIISIGILLGLGTVVRTDRTDSLVMDNLNDRNELIAQVLTHHPVSTLVGDYWRVVPVKYLSSGRQVVTPLVGCSERQLFLSSQSWHLDLTRHSFAYLYTRGRSNTGYTSCRLQQIFKDYGRPNLSVLIAGSLDHPVEQLLIYDNGANRSAPKSRLKISGTILPINLSQLPNTSCTEPTIMQIVAHQDDDLLFMNPDLAHSIQAGDCIRTVFLTAGDAGKSQFYWLGREQGSEAAYSTMTPQNDNFWVNRIVKLADHEFINIANPKANSKISLIFIHLPDGNMQGQGFKATNYESLARLAAGKIKLISAVDKQSYYSSDQLITGLVALMNRYRPAEIRTQASFVSHKYPDHSDHMAAGAFAKLAYQQYQNQSSANQPPISIVYYIGYPIHQLNANLSAADVAEKSATFFSYAAFDPGACYSSVNCQKTHSTYSVYLSRQYQNPY